MASVLELFREILCKFRFTRSFFHRFFKRWVLFLAFLGRRLGTWRQWSDRGRSTFQKAGCSSPGTTTRLESKKCGVAGSHIPASASHPSLHNTWSTSQQSSTTPAPADPVEPPSPSPRDHANPSSAFESRIHSNRRSTDSSIRSRSRASDRLSIIQAHPHESFHTPSSQPIQFPRVPHRSSGRGSSASPSRERPSRSASPTDHFPQPRLGIDITNPLYQTHVDGSRNCSTVCSHAHASLSPPSIHRHHGRQSSTSVIVGVENPSTDSLLLSSSTNRPPLTDEPYTIGSPIGQSSPVTDAPNTREGSTNSPTASSPSASSNFELPASRFLQLINSEQVPRYTKDVTVSLEGTYFEIPPLTRTFPYSPEQMSLEQGSLKEDCAPWVPATHPEGALYFFDQDRRLFTDTDMHDPVLREEMEDFYHYLQRILDRDGVAIPSNNYDLALDIVRLEDGRTSWSYYYACHETRCLFWLDPYDATYMTLEVFGLKSPAHIKHRLESLYWTHWSLFPAVFKGRRLGHAIIDELLGMLSHGCMDILTSKSSTLPYDSDTMHKMLKLVQNAKESDAGLVYHTAGVTRSLSFFAHWRFLYFHGQSSARLEKNEKTYSSEKQKRTLLITSLSPALFFAPEGYLRELEKKCLDETIIEGNWGHVISGLLEEWEQLVLPSTVMLSANVGFLATPGVVISNLNSNITGTNQVVIFTSPAQIASCMSIVASAGSIMIALLLIRHSNPKRKGDLTNAASYLYANTHQPFGLEPMAIIFSLPWALLLFSMVAFFVALLLFCFGTSNASTRIFVAVTSVVVALPIGLCIKSPWGSSNAMETWFSRIKLSITHALDSTCATYHRIAALIDFGPHRGSPSSPTSDPAGSAHSMPDHVGVVNV